MLVRLHKCAIPYHVVIDQRNGDHVVRVTTSTLDQEIIEVIDRLPQRFCDLDFKISTGPVVTFRSTQFLKNVRSANTAPLLWMHNVRPFITRFPEKNGKPTHIEVTDSSKRLLLPARRYVLLKRFTAKEEKRRLVAGIVEPEDSYSEWVGLENHLNYIYRSNSELTSAEAFGLAAWFNSSLVDRYFRVISGSTQVNATEIRTLPVPDQSTLVEIGSQVEQLADQQGRNAERIVEDALKLPKSLEIKISVLSQIDHNHSAVF